MRQVYMYTQVIHKCVCQSLQDFAIAEFIAKSSKRRNFRKSSQIFVIAADFTQILGLGTSSQSAFSQRKVVSQFEKWNEQPCIMHHDLNLYASDHI